MANVKLVYGSSTETCWNSTGKITTPSLILNDGGTLRYTPLFSGSAGGTATSGNYRYTLGHLIVDGKRCALSQTQYKKNFTIRGNMSCSVSTSTYNTTSSSGTSQTTTTHYKKTYTFNVSVSAGNGYVNYITSNLVRLSYNGNSNYSGSWSEESTSGYPGTRETVIAIQSHTSLDGYSISNSYQNIKSGTPNWSGDFSMSLSGTR